MRSSTIIALASWSAGVLGFDNEFLFPTDKDLTFFYKNTIEVQYQSDFESPTLYTYCKVDGKPTGEFPARQDLLQIILGSIHSTWILISLAFTDTHYRGGQGYCTKI